jgi:hypothetical protein
VWSGNRAGIGTNPDASRGSRRSVILPERLSVGSGLSPESPGERPQALQNIVSVCWHVAEHQLHLAWKGCFKKLDGAQDRFCAC